jgi:hypothetical protein
MELDKGKTADRKGTVKTVWQKTGMAFKKKKKDFINVIGNRLIAERGIRRFKIKEVPS